MKRIITLVLIGFFLSGCSFFQVHKMEIEQGNIISYEKIHELHRGMTQAEVKNVMGTPVLINIFAPNRYEYVYTFQPGYGKLQEKRLTCLFLHGRLSDFRTN